MSVVSLWRRGRRPHPEDRTGRGVGPDADHAANALVPMHPEPGPDAATVRWVVPAGTIGLTGLVRRAPTPLAALLDDGTLARVVLEPGAVLTCLGAGRSWTASGALVRTALHAALAEPSQWRTDDAPQPAAGPLPIVSDAMPCGRWCPAASACASRRH